MYDWGEHQRFKFCIIFSGEIGFVYRLARTTFLSEPVFIFNAKTFNKSVFFFTFIYGFNQFFDIFRTEFIVQREGIYLTKEYRQKPTSLNNRA